MSSVDVAPIANWQAADSVPSVDVYSERDFWVAVKSIRKDRFGVKSEHKFVFCAQYVNRPLITDEHGDLENDDYFVDESGEPVHAVGWHSSKESNDFDGFYEPLMFSESYILLGWAAYLTPEFSGVADESND